MQKLTAEQLSAIKFKAGLTRSSKVDAFYNELKTLLVGEALVILKSEWPLKTPPAAYTARKVSGVVINIRTLDDNSGWALIRKE